VSAGLRAPLLRKETMRMHMRPGRQLALATTRLPREARDSGDAHMLGRINPDDCPCVRRPAGLGSPGPAPADANTVLARTIRGISASLQPESVQGIHAVAQRFAAQGQAQLGHLLPDGRLPLWHRAWAQAWSTTLAWFIASLDMDLPTLVYNVLWVSPLAVPVASPRISLSS
jgi:hypothetical protein